MDSLPEFEEERPATAPSGPGRQRAGAWRAPWVRALIIAMIVVAALACVLGQMAPGGWRGVAARLFAPAPTRVVVPTPTPIIPTPAPPQTGTLAPPPTDCPVAAPLDSLVAQAGGFNGPVPMLGKSPVWIPDPYLPFDDTYIAFQPGPTATNAYPQIKIVWEIGPTQHPEVMVRVTDIRTGELAWWTGIGGTPSSPVLDLDNGFNRAFTGWADTPTSFAVTHSGCYRMDVAWSGGGWSTTFAVGGASPSH